MSREACPFESPDCRHYDRPDGCFSDRHHIFYPRKDYQTSLEKSFRRLPENIVDLPRCLHDDGHALEEPPIKPSVEVMREAVNQHKIEHLVLRGVSHALHE